MKYRKGPGYNRISHEKDGNRYVYVCWIGERAESEVEYVTISVLESLEYIES